MSSTSYNSKLRDARWQKKRLEIMERDKWTCRSCGMSASDEPGISFNVHHAYYDKGLDPWEYPQESMVTWCDNCHEERHERAHEIAAAIAQLDQYSYCGLVKVICKRKFRVLFFHLGVCNEVTEQEVIDFLRYLESEKEARHVR